MTTGIFQFSLPDRMASRRRFLATMASAIAKSFLSASFSKSPDEECRVVFAGFAGPADEDEAFLVLQKLYGTSRGLHVPDKLDICVYEDRELMMERFLMILRQPCERLPAVREQIKQMSANRLKEIVPFHPHVRDFRCLQFSARPENREGVQVRVDERYERDNASGKVCIERGRMLLHGEFGSARVISPRGAGVIRMLAE